MSSGAEPRRATDACTFEIVTVPSQRSRGRVLCACRAPTPFFLCAALVPSMLLALHLRALIMFIKLSLWSTGAAGFHMHLVSAHRRHVCDSLSASLVYTPLRLQHPRPHRSFCSGQEGLGGREVGLLSELEVVRVIDTSAVKCLLLCNRIKRKEKADNQYTSPFIGHTITEPTSVLKPTAFLPVPGRGYLEPYG